MSCTSNIGSTGLPPHLSLVRASERPDLYQALQDPKHPLRICWPSFLDLQPAERGYFDALLGDPYLRKYQLFVIEKQSDSGAEEAVIAWGYCIPFFWPALDRSLADPTFSQVGSDTWNALNDDLPLAGWDVVFELGLRQHFSRNRECCCYPRELSRTLSPETSSLPWGPSEVLQPDSRWVYADGGEAPAANALCALQVTVVPEYRSQGIADAIFHEMRSFARTKAGLKAMVVPVRPTRKSDYINVSIEDYLCRVSSSDLKNGKSNFQNLSEAFSAFNNGTVRPFDPWVRKHIAIGGKIAKIAPYSMVVKGSSQEWESVGKLPPVFQHAVNGGRVAKNEVYSDENYIEISNIPGSLVPIRYYVQQDIAEYVEPNLWIRHF